MFVIFQVLKSCIKILAYRLEVQETSEIVYDLLIYIMYMQY